MEIKMSQDQAYVTLQPIGDLDANSSVHLDEMIRELIGEDQVNIHVDFSKINYISSAGMGVFISYLDEINGKGGKIVLSQMKENVLDVFNLLGLNQLLTIVGEPDEVATVFNQ